MTHLKKHKKKYNKYFQNLSFVICFSIFVFVCLDSRSDENNPVQKYSLIGVFIVEDEPRALIKDLKDELNQENEYTVGDFLDSEKTISVSKVLLYPTPRVEIIDSSGLTYLLRPSVIAGKGMTSTSSSPSPSSPGSSYKYNQIKKKYPPPRSITPPKPIEPQEQKPAEAPPAQAEVKKESAPDSTPQEQPKQEQPKQEQPKQEQPKQEALPQMSKPEDLDVTRPKNPFE